MAKRQSTTPATDLVPADVTDIQFVQRASVPVLAFLKSLPDFFKKAAAIEKAATGILADAVKMSVPADVDGDVKLQAAIKRVNQGKLVAAAHWDGSKEQPGITRILFALHRRTTNRRDIAVDALDRASVKLNNLHNDYEREAKAAAERERQRLQDIEDKRAADLQQKELDDLEAVALKAEAASDALSGREAAFAALVAAGSSPVKAAAAAGFKTPAQTAERLLKAKKVIKAIEGLKAAAAAREQAQAVKDAPVQATQVDVKPELARAPGTSSRTTHKPVIVDAAKVIDAVFKGLLPRDVLCIDTVRLNQYTRDTPTVVARWPGIEVVEDRKVV